MNDFKNLKVWEKAHELVLGIYTVTKKFPKQEEYGITSQLRRAVVSIPTNIAEGSGKMTQKNFAHFLQIALGSCHEVEYLVFLSHDLGYTDESLNKGLALQIGEVIAMLIGLIKKVRSNKN